MAFPYFTCCAPRIKPLWLCVAALLTVHLCLGIDAARRLTVTHDEYWHLPAGVAAWRSGRFDADNLNPPLTRMWDALPLVFTSARVDSTVPAGDAFRLGDTFLSANREQYDHYLTLARSMNVLFSVLTGALLANWANGLFGPKSALLVAALWAFCPTALAHGALVTPDMGGTCLFAGALFCTWRFANRPTWANALAVGVLLGLAQLAKFTNLLLFPLCVATWILVRVRCRTVPVAGWRDALGRWVVAAALSLAVLNAGYLFHGSFSRLDSFKFQSRAIGRVSELLRPVSGLPVPLPRDYLEGLDRQRQIMEGPHPVYLEGAWRLDGFPDYYARALAYKLPHATEGLLILAALYLAFPARLPRMGRVQWMLLLPVLVVAGVASSISMQLGVRYVLPALAVLFVWGSQAARWLEWRRFRVRTLLLVLLILLLPIALRFHPHHLAYFNELAGGPIGGRSHLLDSNLDWGQDLEALARYLKKERIDEIGLAYFGMMPPSELGIHYRLPPSRRAEPGWFAVSANFLYGRPHTIRSPDGNLRSAGFEEFAYFRRFHPVARIGYSIEVFQIEPADPPRGGEQ